MLSARRSWKVNATGPARGGVVTGDSSAQPGAIFLILCAGDHGHVWLVSTNLSDGSLATIEGNTGNAVRALLRDRPTFAAIVRPAPL